MPDATPPPDRKAAEAAVQALLARYDGTRLARAVTFVVDRLRDELARQENAVLRHGLFDRPDEEARARQSLAEYRLHLQLALALRDLAVLVAAQEGAQGVVDLLAERHGLHPHGERRRERHNPDRKP